MRRLHLLGWALIGGMGLAQFATAQEAPAAKPAASPFADVKKDGEAPRQPAGHEIELAEPLAADQTLEERLEARAYFKADEATLKSFAEALVVALNAPVVLSSKKLEEAAINLDTPMTYRLHDARVRTALRLILSNVGLTYVIYDDVLVITTPEDAGSQLITRVYDCRELIKLPSPIKKLRKERPRGHFGPAAPSDAQEEKPSEPARQEDYTIDDLIDVVTTTVVPDSWDEVGGPGSLTDFKGLLTINQTEEVHEKVENLLNMLHKAGELEGKVKVSR